MTNTTAPKPRDFRKHPAAAREVVTNPLQLRALADDELEAREELAEGEAGRALRQRLELGRMSAERLVPLTNAEAGALLVLADVALRTGIADGDARPIVEVAKLKLARVIASV